MDYEKTEADPRAYGVIGGTLGLASVDKPSPIYTQLQQLDKTLSMLDEAVNMLGNKTATVRAMTPTAESSQTEKTAGYSEMTERITALDRAAVRILQKVSSIIDELEL